MQTYIARNTKNGKFYIGSTVNFEHRKNQHFRDSSELPFHRALRKNPSDFEWEVFEDNSEGRELEQALLDMFFGTEMCYNLNPNADSINWSPKGKIWVHKGSEESWCEEGKEIPEGWEKGRGWDPSEAVREVRRKRATGWSHPNQSGNTGRVWVVNSNFTQEKFLQMGEEIPEGWKKGRLPRTPTKETCEKIGNHSRGRKWWNDGKGNTKHCSNCPGEGWMPGRG